MSRISVVVGGQFGSEAKGHVAGWLGSQPEYMNRPEMALAVVRVAGPNAGHSAVDDEGRTWALRQIPVVAVTNRQARLVIGAGSEIDPEVLFEEIGALENGGFNILNRLYIDGQATVLTAEHFSREGGNDGPMQRRLGSTGKGVGAARSDRIMRQAQTWEQWVAEYPEDQPEYPIPTNLRPLNTAELLRVWQHQNNADIIIEGTQGYGLGLHAGYYPYCTSSDCRAIDFLAMAGLNPWDPTTNQFEIWIVLRTYPIRVAGNSGPLKDETTWEALGELTNGYIKEERTTVTKKVRRVGMWDVDLAAAAIAANGGSGVCKVALMFYDYFYPELAGATKWEQLTPDQIDTLEAIQTGLDCEIGYLGTGPGTGIDLRNVTFVVD